MTNLQRFQFHIKDALNVLEAKQYEVKQKFDEVQEEYKDNKCKEWAEKSEGMAESGVQLGQMIIQLKKCLEFNF